MARTVQATLMRRLREARSRSGLSQKKLGIEAGIDEFTASARVNQYERGKHAPDVQLVSRLAAVLRVPVPYFYCADEDLAQLILLFGSLDKNQKKNALALLEKLKSA